MMLLKKITQKIDMSASNHNYVCFECRTAIRHPKMAANAPSCRVCGIECFCLGYKVEIPKCDDLRSWRLLRDECNRRHAAAIDNMDVRAVRRQHDIEQEIRRLKEMPDNKDRNRQIRDLERALERINANKTGGQSSPPAS